MCHACALVAIGGDIPRPFGYGGLGPTPFVRLWCGAYAPRFVLSNLALPVRAFRAVVTVYHVGRFPNLLLPVPPFRVAWRLARFPFGCSVGVPLWRHLDYAPDGPYLNSPYPLTLCVNLTLTLLLPSVRASCACARGFACPLRARERPCRWRLDLGLGCPTR